MGLLDLPDAPEEWECQCLTMLELMNSSIENTWSIPRAKLYRLVFRMIGSDASQAACLQAMLIEQWRPSPARLREIAAEIASPCPSADDAYAEMMEKAATLGIYGARHATRPSIMIEGEPSFSHALISKTVAQCGGWRMICSGEAQMSEGLSKQFKSAYRGNVERWVQDVAAALSLPAPQRPRHLFPRQTVRLIQGDSHAA